MFCPNCGKKCDSGAFCWNCGAKLPERAAVSAETPSASASPTASGSGVPSSVQARTAPTSELISGTLNSSATRSAALSEGVIFTNLRALAVKLHTDSEILRRLLEAYIDAAWGFGIRYHLIDASDYGWLNPEVNPGSRVRLSPTDSWVMHIALLADYYRFGRRTAADESNYLFIIGGEDVIPMPAVPHYITGDPDFDEHDIDTDIPYAYLLGERTYELLRSGELFGYEQYFHVGRLPFATDASLDDLTGYLRRASKTGGRLPLRSYYGQVFSPWGEDSQRVTTPLRSNRLATSATQYEGSYAELGSGERIPVVQNGLYYSKPVVEYNVDQVFDRRADIYYFNLHGSDAPTVTGFATNDCMAILPEQLARIEVPNVLVTEACYGARYIQYARNESMLLTAISNQTLLYLGSSRIAFCNNRYQIDNSDRLAHVYLTELFKGHTAGEALYLARKSFFECDDGRLYDQQLASIVEFNLFGDPFLRAHADDTSGRSLPEGKAVLTTRRIHTVRERRCLSRSVQGRELSLLDQVRQAVDRNVMQIRQTVDRVLYDRLGVEPRRLETIFSNRFDDGESFYAFTYGGDARICRELHTVLTDHHGNIKTIVSTK